MYRNRIARSAVVLATAGLVALAGAPLASAHVSAEPEQAPKGEHAKITFRVPNEKPDSGTVRVHVTLPTDKPLSSVKTKPKPGWTVEVDKVKLDRPVTVAGARVDEAVRGITWTAQPGTRIAPDQFEEFEADLGTLPTDTDRLVLPTEQTYDNGQVVRWDTPPPQDGSEPEHPAPTLRLVNSTGHAHQAGSGAADSGQPGGAHAAEASGDDTARVLGGAGLVVGALGIGLAVGALLRTRKGAGS